METGIKVQLKLRRLKLAKVNKQQKNTKGVPLRIKMKKTSLVYNSSSQAMSNSASGLHQVSHHSRHKWSFTGSFQTRKSSILVGGSNRKHNTQDNGSNQAPTKTVKVFENGRDVTPLALSHAGSGGVQSKPGRVFLDEIFPSSGSDFLKSTSSSNVPYFGSFFASSRPSSLSTTASLTRETEDSVSKLHIPIHPPPPCEEPRKRDTLKQNVTEEMLDEVIDFCLSETETISLLDIPPRFMSDDADDAEAVQERNIKYAELCKNRMGNDKFVVRSMQTFSGAPKNKESQTDQIFMVDEGTIATTWDIYDSFCEQRETSESENAEYPENTVNTHQEKRGEMYSSSSSTVCTGSTVGSVLEMEMSSSSFNAESDLQTIMLSESFQHSLLVMERSIVANCFQPKLAAYRQLPTLEDPDSTVQPGTEEQSEDDEESSSSPALEHLWAFSCELTRGCNITSMAWGKKNPDLLAVAYGHYDSNQSLICCWSLKNPMWPERVFRCHSCVTTLDFSANSPSQLAVGMFDGTVAIYDVQSQDKVTCIANSSECSKKHLRPVWQVNWTKQEMTLSGEDRVEALVSVSADGRITKWFLCSSGLECIDLIRLKKIQNSQKKAAENKKKKKKELFLSALTPGLCVDFHPTDFSVYLAGTWDGPIHKCSISNSENFLATYQKHISPVNHIEWSPFCSDVFLSCSSDWTIQLWKQDRPTPLLSFTSIQGMEVFNVRWSPNWSTVFAALTERQVEIWDLNSSILHPTIVHHAAPGVKVTSLLFATGTDCVLVGDTDGQVTVYQLKNLSVGEGKQVDSLEDIIGSAVSR